MFYQELDGRLSLPAMREGQLVSQAHPPRRCRAFKAKARGFDFHAILKKGHVELVFVLPCDFCRKNLEFVTKNWLREALPPGWAAQHLCGLRRQVTPRERAIN